MKANQKFLNHDDDAVSPVIAVILMVAITVVLAATVYVWVSGFGQSGSQAKNLSLSQVSCTNGSDTVGSGTQTVVKFTVVSVSSNFAITALKVTDATTSVSTLAGFAGTSTPTAANPGLGSSSASANLAAGDVLTITTYGIDSATSIANNDDITCADTINWVDTASNTVVSTLALHV